MAIISDKNSEEISEKVKEKWDRHECVCKLMFLKEEKIESFFEKHKLMIKTEEEEGNENVTKRRKSYGETKKKKILWKNFTHQIIPNFLFLGDFNSATELSLLQYYKISYVINASNFFPSLFTKNSIHYLQVDVDDEPTENIFPYFEQSVNFIEECKNKNLVFLFFHFYKFFFNIIIFFLKN